MGKWRYGVVIDAGSSGSRVYVYKWLNSTRARQTANPHELASLPIIEPQETKKIRPGISTFGSKVDGVGREHLDKLLEHALEIIPEESVDDTPIFLLATAGVRLLPKFERQALLEKVCSHIRKTTKFLLPDCDIHIQVIPGETEGLYGWIAANYLLGGFDEAEAHDHGKGHHTYGFLDMGGASAQIAFAPNQTEAERHADDLKLLRLRTIDGKASEYRVFVTTWLEFGVHEARRRFVERLLESAGLSSGEIPDPCSPRDLTISTKGDILAPDKINGKEIRLRGTGNFKECLKATWPLLEKFKECADPPCLINGVHVPAIDFDVNHFVGVSEYWHTTHEIFEMGHKDKAYDFKTYQQRVDAFCSEEWKSIEQGIKAKKWGKKVDEATASEVCFKASWLINMLHEGIGIPRTPIDHVDNASGKNTTKAILEGIKEKGFTDAFQAVNKIEKKEVSWTLGKIALYAASEIPPAKTNSLPVGFGSNVKGVPADWQYAGSRHGTPRNTTNPDSSEGESWRDTLFEGKTPRRIPGLLLFLLIVCIALFLLSGKDRRSRIYRKVFGRFGRGNPGRPSRRRGLFGKSLRPNRNSEAREHLLESGRLEDPEDFELGSMDSDSDSTGSNSSKKSLNARSSGRMTPALRSAKGAEAGAKDGSVGGMSIPVTNAMDRSGLFVRNESRESLSTMAKGERGGGRPRSRRGSPTRAKRDWEIGD